MDNIMKNTYLLLLGAAVLFAGCEKKTMPQPNPPITDSVARVFIMYDNIGAPYFGNDAREAATAVAGGALAQGHHVVVFHKNYTDDDPATDDSERNVIYEIVRDTTVEAGYRIKILKDYDRLMSRFDFETVSTVIGDMRGLVSAEHYGLAFGSHGRGWIPKENNTGLGRRSAPVENPFAALWQIPENPETRYLAGYGGEMNVSEFADAIDEWDWDFIIFDDCFMASIEAQYEIRHLADYFIASPTEILIQGFPYDRVVKALFRDWNDMDGVAAGYIAYYDRQSSPYATVSLIDTSRLEDLARSVRAILASDLWTGVADPDEADIQYYEQLDTHVFYDLGDFIRAGGITEDDPLYADFREALDSAVIYAGHTDNFYSKMYSAGEVIPVRSFSGLSTFIPWSGTEPLMRYYVETPWYEDVYPGEEVVPSSR